MTPSTSDNLIINKWGECIMKSEYIIRIDADDVLDNIQQNNPAITAVEVADDDGGWLPDGEIIGNSRHLQFLELTFVFREIRTLGDVKESNIAIIHIH
jgi:hypothetical protein